MTVTVKLNDGEVAVEGIYVPLHPSPDPHLVPPDPSIFEVYEVWFEGVDVFEIMDIEEIEKLVIEKIEG